MGCQPAAGLGCAHQGGGGVTPDIVDTIAGAAVWITLIICAAIVIVRWLGND